MSNVKTEPYRDTRGPGVDVFGAAMAQGARKNDPKSIRDRAILRLLFDLGLRRGEVVGLDLEDVDLSRGTLTVLGKGRTQKEHLSLPNPTQAAVEAWLEIRGDKAGPVFRNFDRAGKGDGRLTATGVYAMVRRLGEAIGRRIRPHGLRHTSITEAVKLAQKNGLGLEEVLDFSRHADVKTLLVYRDRERNVQGRLASLVADSVGAPSPNSFDAPGRVGADVHLKGDYDKHNTNLLLCQR